MKILLSALLMVWIVEVNAQNQRKYFANVDSSNLQAGDEFLIEFRFPFGSKNSICEEEHNLPYIDSILQLFNENPTLKVEIITHTDSRGDANNNLRLSANRSAMIKDCLVAKNIYAGYILIFGKGENEPIHSEDEVNKFKQIDKQQFEIMHQQNRRTILKVVSL